MEITEKNRKGIIDKVWDFFASVKLAVIIFSVISLTSIVGTIIEQSPDSANNLKLLANVFGISGAHTAYNIINAIGFTDMFNAWWFIALLFVFAMNLIICSVERLPGIFRIVRERIKPLPRESFDSGSSKREALINANAAKAEAMVIAALKKIGFNGQVVKGEGMTQVCAEKGRYSRLGVYITHLSILVILFGAVVGMKFGFNGSIRLLEGTSTAVAQGNNGKEMPLGFEIRCDDFEVLFYPDSERPKTYRSVLTVVETGRDVLTKVIEVNSPLRYKGVTFYQSTYGFYPNRDSLFKFRLTTMEGKPQDVSVKFGQTFEINGTKMTAKVVDFSPALAMNESNELFTFAEAMINPAAFVEFTEGGKVKSRQWILKNYSETWRTPAGVLEFKDLWGSQFTGLQVRKDPGVWLVYLGCLVMAGGLYIAFFTSHARVWILMKEEKNSTKLVISSFTNKNRIAFDQKLDKLVKELGRES